jgi:regulator of sirC expression with transglutaminase-like and TPR domain
MRLRSQYASNLNEIKLIYDWKQATRKYGHDISLDLGAFLISRISGNPDITFDDFKESLDRLSIPLVQKISTLMPTDHDSKIRALQSYLFDTLGFRGNTEDYYNPCNSFITDVIETKRGIPVSLSVVVLLIGWRAGLPIYGVNLPGHFVIKYRADSYRIYMDPFNKGNLLTEDECYQFLSWQGLEPSRGYLSEAGVPAILIRMYRNLISYYSREGDVRMENYLSQHLNLLQEVYLNS